MNNYFEEEEEEFETLVDDYGCGFCRDKRSGKDIELYFLDRANNMRPCTYCPACGRKM